jgi:methylenetetrahydrofolate dehydrogenase (NADP+)/methenyltetrahydrofolate cyclohydrolase
MILDGKKIALAILEDLKHKITKNSVRPGLHFILVGNDFASEKYVMRKEKMCNHLGIRSTVKRMPQLALEKDILSEIEKSNMDPLIDGILVQTPLPGHLNTKNILSKIDPNKDVDGLHPQNVGKMAIGDFSGFIPCTPKGILTLMEKYHIDPQGKHVVIVGRSNLVGKPLAILLMQNRPNGNATVTITHSHTPNLSYFTKQADILIVAIGKARFIKKEMIKPGTVIIDVGINRENSNIVGDVDFENVLPLVKAITPVPGGVGPMTIASLMENTYESFLRRN